MSDGSGAGPADRLGGPFFEDLAVGQVFDGAPSLTVTHGHQAVHQAVVGDRLRLVLDHRLGRAVTGQDAPPVDPALVWEIAIGQSSLVTRHVIANLYYRGLTFHRLPVVGDTLGTRTEILALRRSRSRPGAGLVLMGITMHDQQDRAVLEFSRCAMIPLRDPAGAATADTEFPAAAAAFDRAAARQLVSGWDTAAFRRPGHRSAVDGLQVGDVLPVPGGDVVSGAPELARLTLNVAAVHYDEYAAGGRRLVFGGQVIGLALAQLTRVLPDVLTVAAWQGCEHLAPVNEGDTLRSTLTVEAIEALTPEVTALHLRSAVHSVGDDRAVLDWRPVVLL